MIMGIPFARWGARPFIVHPIPYPERSQVNMQECVGEKIASQSPVRHPIQTALEWRQMLSADTTLTMAAIARNMGLSRARVTQIMNLLDLPKPIISFIAGLQKPTHIRIISERKLRAMLELTSKPAQLRAFALLRAELTQTFRTRTNHCHGDPLSAHI